MTPEDSTMTASRNDFSPQFFARVAGFLYLIIIAGGVYAEMFVRQKFFVANDIAATARNILLYEQEYRWAFIAQLVPLLCNMFLAPIFYAIFKIVNRHLALAIAFCSVAGSAVEAASLLMHYAPLTLLKRGAQLGLDQHLLQSQAYMALGLQSVGFSIALTFFGCVCIARGYLIIRSRFFPRTIGILLAIEGVCYLINSFGLFLAPQFAARVFAVLLVFGLAEVVFCLWLLVRGLDVEKWEQRAFALASR
jgi:hypothetical protein